VFVAPFEIMPVCVYGDFCDGICPGVGEYEGEDRASHFAECEEEGRCYYYERYGYWKCQSG